MKTMFKNLGLATIRSRELESDLSIDDFIISDHESEEFDLSRPILRREYYYALPGDGSVDCKLFLLINNKLIACDDLDRDSIIVIGNNSHRDSYGESIIKYFNRKNIDFKTINKLVILSHGYEGAPDNYHPNVRGKYISYIHIYHSLKIK